MSKDDWNQWGWYIRGHFWIWVVSGVLGALTMNPVLLGVSAIYSIGVCMVVMWPEYWLGSREDS